MKKFLLLLCFVVTFALSAEQYPHLILNFDINKTLIASDKTENKSIEDVINELLTRKYFACWDKTVLEPISFDAYVRTVLLPGDEHNIKLKEERLVHLIHFIDYLREHQHPLYPTVYKEFTTILETLKGAQGNIFPSFYRLIAELDQNEIPYTLFLRSFGKEVFEVKTEINSVLKDVFKIDGMFRKGALHINGKGILTNSQEIYDFFCSKEHAAIHDDWPYWVAGEMKAKYGKPLFIDQKDKDFLAIFFDDNVKINSTDKNIISPIDCKTDETLSIPHLIQSRQIVQVNTLDAILNERYYVELVQEALHHYRTTVVRSQE